MIAFCILSVQTKAEKNDTIYYNVSKYGVKGNGKTDDLPALTRLFLKASQQKRPAKVVFAPGKVYRIGQHTEDLYGRVLINRADNLVVEGNGCTLLIHPSSRAFAVYRSKNIVIRNFKIDYSPLPYTQGRVSKVDADNYYLEFKIDSGYPAPVTGDEPYKNGGKIVDCITANGKTRKFFQGHSWVKEVEDLGNGTFGVKYDLRKQEQLKQGDFFCMKLPYPESRLIQNNETKDAAEKGEFIYTNTANIAAQQCDGLILENITSYAAPLMTFVLKGCSRHILRNCSIISKDNRIVAGCSDGMHLKGNEHQPRIENCHIERTMDDAIHIKMSGDAIKEILATNKFKIEHKDILWDNTNLGKGKKVMVFNPETSKQLAECTITDYEPLNYREGIVTLDKNVAEADTKTCLYLQSDEEAVITGCTLGTQLQRGILTHQPTKVTNCTIEDNGLAFELALLSGGIEGPPTQKLTIENCIFRNLVWGGISVNCPSHDYNQKGTPQLVVKNNIFDLRHNIPLVSAVNSNGVSFTGNKIITKKANVAEASLFRLINTPVLENSNNLYTSQP